MSPILISHLLFVLKCLLLSMDLNTTYLHDFCLPFCSLYSHYQHFLSGFSLPSISVLCPPSFLLSPSLPFFSSPSLPPFSHLSRSLLPTEIVQALLYFYRLQSNTTSVPSLTVVDQEDIIDIVQWWCHNTPYYQLAFSVPRDNFRPLKQAYRTGDAACELIDFDERKIITFFTDDVKILRTTTSFSSSKQPSHNERRWEPASYLSSLWFHNKNAMERLTLS